MKKVGILYIVTGEYWKFWEDFYESCEKNFLKDCELNYFLFTDCDVLLKNNDSRIHSVFLEQQEWPYPTLLRYQTFFREKERLNDMDYLIFCNANILFTSEICFFELFGEKNLFATLHPGHYTKPYNKLPLEKNKDSLAYFKCTEYTRYFCGGFNGGSKNHFLELVENLMNNISGDLQKNIIARWHDESHINKYINKNIEKFNVLDASFCYPENRRLALDRRILIRDKDKVISIEHKGKIYTIRYAIIKFFRTIFTNFKDLKC